MTAEVKEKLKRVRTLMQAKKLDGILLTTVQNFFWISGGKQGFVDKSSESATAKVLILENEQYAICNSSEQYRVFDEELTDKTFKLIAYKWHEDEKKILQPYMEGKKIGSDTGIYGTIPMGPEIQELRYSLTPAEIKRYHEIGPECAGILEKAVRETKPGETEFQAAGRVTSMLMAKGYQVPVCLVASDERILKYRHPLPTAKKIGGSVLIAICGQKYGLTVSITRMAYFKAIPAEIRKKYDVLLNVDATYILNTKVGVPSCEILKKGYEAYKAGGYGRDFDLHHQGGPLGYPTRDFCTKFCDDQKVVSNQGYSWNPTIAGVKLEDTYIIRGNRQDIVSDTGKWV